MKKFKKISTLFLSLVMMMSLSSNVFAEDTVPPINDGQSVSITSKFIFADGLKVPNGTDGITFKYNAISTTPDAATATISDVTFKDSDRTDTFVDDQGLYTLSKTQTITFDKWKHAGPYEYTVEQTAPTLDGLTPSTTKYTMRVYVKNTEDGLEIASVTAVKQGTSDKLEAMVFENTYRKMGSLTVTKKTVGNYADKTKLFDFGINFNASPTASNVTEVKGTITDKDGNFLDLNGNKLTIETTYDFVVGTNSTTFKLKDGDTLKFTQLPIGMKFFVSETGTPGYKGSILVISNDTHKNYDSFDEGGVAKSDHALVGEGQNKAEFTNTNNTDLPLTGVFMNNLPFILLIGIGAGGLALLAVSKKRRAVNR